MYRNVIFDLDGTLLNTIDDLADCCNWVCRNHGWPERTVAEYQYFVGRGMANLVRQFVPEPWRTPEGVQEILQEYMPYYAAHKEDRTAPYPGIVPMLARLQQAGVRMAVLSNKAHSATAPIIESYFPGVFFRVQGAVDGLPLKPEPDLVYRLMERMGAGLEDTLFVGDSDVDVRTAKNAGLPVCGVLWGFRTKAELEAEKPDFLAATPEELAGRILSRPEKERTV